MRETAPTTTLEEAPSIPHDPITFSKVGSITHSLTHSLNKHLLHSYCAGHCCPGTASPGGDLELSGSQSEGDCDPRGNSTHKVLGRKEPHTFREPSEGQGEKSGMGWGWTALRVLTILNTLHILTLTSQQPYDVVVGVLPSALQTRKLKPGATKQSAPNPTAFKWENNMSQGMRDTGNKNIKKNKRII